MRKLRWILGSFIALTAAPALANAQQTGTIQGTVVDATSLRPLASVQVFIPTPQIGLSTGAPPSRRRSGALLSVGG